MFLLWSLVDLWQVVRCFPSSHWTEPPSGFITSASKTSLSLKATATFQQRIIRREKRQTVVDRLCLYVFAKYTKGFLSVGPLTLSPSHLLGLNPPLLFFSLSLSFCSILFQPPFLWAALRLISIPSSLPRTRPGILRASLIIQPARWIFFFFCSSFVAGNSLRHWTMHSRPGLQCVFTDRNRNGETTLLSFSLSLSLCLSSLTWECEGGNERARRWQWFHVTLFFARV